MVTSILLLSVFCTFHPITIDSTPICSAYRPNSILQNNKEQYRLQFVGDRTRYSTCTSVEWFHDNYLATLSLWGNTIITYQFDPARKTFAIVQKISPHDGAPLNRSEHMAISPDGTLLAVGDQCSKITIYAINLQNHLIDPIPKAILRTAWLVHNVRFSRDGTYLAYVTFDKKQAIGIYKIKRTSQTIDLRRVYLQTNQMRPLRPKAINFTQDNKYALILYCPAIEESKQIPPRHKLIVYPFDQETGTLGKSVHTLEGNFPSEDIEFLDNDRAFVIPDQAHDMLVLYKFDPYTGYIDPQYMLLQNPEAQLSFPHGVAVSPNGKYLAVANYGDDKFNLYKINKRS